MKDAASNVRLLLLFVAAVLYTASLFLPALHTEMRSIGEVTPNVWRGSEVLLIGWAGVLGAKDWSPAWYANPLLGIAIALYAVRRRSCFVVSGVAALLAFTSLFFEQIWNDKDPPERVVSYGVGFYLWLLSVLVFVLVTWLRRNELSTSEGTSTQAR